MQFHRLITLSTSAWLLSNILALSWRGSRIATLSDAKKECLLESPGHPYSSPVLDLHKLPMPSVIRRYCEASELEIPVSLLLYRCQGSDLLYSTRNAGCSEVSD
jgi:hypothetical protein